MMAISHAQPLIIFIVSLLIFPAFAIKARYCNDYERSLVKIETVEISPKPVWSSSDNVNFTLIGETSQEIPEGVIVKLKLTLPGRKSNIPIKSYSLCDVTACPVSPGPIVLTFTNVFTEEELLANWGYYVWISISEDEDEKKKDEMMCVVFGCFIRKGFASMLHQATE